MQSLDQIYYWLGFYCFWFYVVVISFVLLAWGIDQFIKHGRKVSSRLRNLSEYLKHEKDFKEWMKSK